MARSEARLRAVMGDPSWARDTRYATAASRLEHQDELERALEAWTATEERYALAERLAAAGVPAAPVQDARDRVERDPQLAARDYFVPLPHTETGVWPLERPPFRVTDGDVHPGGRIRRGPPCLGEDTALVNLTDGDRPRTRAAESVRWLRREGDGWIEERAVR